MAGRPRRNTVDYFPHFIHHKRTMAVIEDRYGVAGYAAWFKLLELLGDSENHFYDAGPKINFGFLQAKLHMNEDSCAGFMELLSELEAIDRNLWSSECVIWCQHFVDNLAEVYRKRRIELPSKPNFRRGNATMQGISVAEMRQRRGEESKEKKRTPTLIPPSPNENGKKTFLEYVKLTDKEHANLLKEFGPDQTEAMITMLDTYIGAMPKKRNKYTDHNRVLRGWVLEKYQEKHPNREVEGGWQV